MIIIHKIDDFLFNLFPSIKIEDKEGRKEEEHLNRLKEELTKFYTFGPYKPEVEVDKDFVKIEIDTSTISSQKSDFDTAVKHCEAGKFKKAKPILEKLIKKNPTVSEYHRILGQIHAEENNQEEAINCLIDALRWDPKNTHALTMMGNIFARHKIDISTAMSYYEQVLTVKPDDHIAMNNIGANLMQLGRLSEAEQYFERAFAINNTYPNTLYALGMIKDIRGDCFSAFDFAIQALKKCNPANPVYGNAFELAQQASLKAIKSIDPSEMFNQYSQKLAIESGKNIEVIQDDTIPTPAKLEMAENYNRDKHIIRYKKDRLAIAHIVMHELGHLDLTTQCRKRNANYLFITTNEHKELFIRNNESIIQKLNKEGFDDKAISDYINALFSGINSQIYNTPVDLFIEDFLYKTYLDLKPFQFLSLLGLLKEYIDAARSKKVAEYSPSTIRNANIILSLVNSLQFKDIFGYDMIHIFKASPQQLKHAKEFYSDYLKYQKAGKSLEAHDLIQKWAKALRLENYFSLIEEGEYRDNPLNPPLAKREVISASVNDFSSRVSFPLVGNQSPTDSGQAGVTDAGSLPIPTLEKGGKGGFSDIQEEPAGEAAVTMYCLSALQYFENKNLEEVKKVGFEIAMLGRQGIDPVNTEKKYHLESIPGKEFSGLQLLAYMYAAFQVIDPFLDTGLKFKKEYEAAKKMKKGKI
ncbi:MAG: tetratricopeptide repeat protein [Nitrospirota bacterium]